MKRYLVTGAAGFIGANFLKYLLKKYEEDIYVVVLDKLTYAGNLGTIKDEIADSRVRFVKGDIRNAELVANIFAETDIDYVVNFAAESHVDRSIANPQLFLETNILGTQNYRCRCAQSGDRTYRPAYLWQAVLYGDDTARSPFSLFGFEDECRYVREGLPRNLRHAGEYYPVFQQLRSLSFPGKIDTSDYQEYIGRSETPGLW